ncbi:hypothetical protein Ctob_005670 [Chrysochromulina tobinii]|uniref:Uncharacterized protein n=1 Tax=Chrysochromulina tobinii TaxID=1460289 RepID=A0A0M0JIT9_9EUKA|nr:hypothetical protein Ctob_005670 [Chrysochromulina tobinii]|eukprot:KOO26153.1 hypothetical protein Ctob_005670 [Chrysochromulina sp. CCMP291]
MRRSDTEDDEARFAVNSVLRPENEVGVATVSSKLFTNVTHYHAQIGADVAKETLQQLEWNLLAEAKTLFHQRKFEEALNTFTHCLAVTEKTRSAKDHAVRGAVIHNIASCLHNLGEMEAAQAYYEQAIEAFKKAYTPLVERAIYGDANKRRIDFVKERLVDISWGRKPDGDKYLDENGNKRPVAPVFGQAAGGAADADEGGEGDDEASQEAARKEWLQYHLQVGEWDKAEELIVTAQEREDLEYLMEKERRERRELQGRAEPARAATGRQTERVGPRSVGPQSAMAHQAAARRNPPPPEPKLIDDNDDMM